MQLDRLKSLVDRPPASVLITLTTPISHHRLNMHSVVQIYIRYDRRGSSRQGPVISYETGTQPIGGSYVYKYQLAI